MKIIEPDRIEERIKQSKWYGNEEVISDVGKLIRCKDCKKHGKPECPVQILFPNDGISRTDDDWYCADGEPKEGEHE